MRLPDAAPQQQPPWAQLACDGVRVQHARAVEEHAFEWCGEAVPLADAQAAAYGPGVSRRPCGFTLRSEDAARSERYQVGTFASVNVLSAKGGKGEVGAPSIALIMDILEDEHGCCHVALHYFWRWGQIHAYADVDTRVVSSSGRPRTAPDWAAELFKQKRHTRAGYAFDWDAGCDIDSHDALCRPDGSYREVVSALQLNHPVTVVTYAEVLQQHGSLDAYEEQAPSPAATTQDSAGARSGARRDCFFWRYEFDHTICAYTCDPMAYVPPPHASCASPGLRACDAVLGLLQQPLPPGWPRRLPQGALVMGDVFCGAGTVAVAARSAGWAVGLGVDSNGDAMASFAANCCPDGFNPPGFAPTMALNCTVEALLQTLNHAGAEGPLPKCAYLHLSPPCQDLSSRKEVSKRFFTGGTLMAVTELVERLQPAYVTLEEVPGFLACAFKRDRLQLVGQQGTHRPAVAAAACSAAGGGGGDAGDTSGGDDSAAGDGDADTASSDCSLKAAGEAAQRLGQQHGLHLPGGGAAAAAASDEVCYRPFLLVVPQLLSMGYQVRLSLLNCVHYGAPQSRWRVFLFAAKEGFQLPELPRPRYEPTNNVCVRSVMVSATCDPTFLPRWAPHQKVQQRAQEQAQEQAQTQQQEQEPNGLAGSPGDDADTSDDEDGDVTAASWFGVLTAELAQTMDHAADGELLPHLTVAEAVGDLPPIMGPSSSSSSSTGASGVERRSEEAASHPAPAGYSSQQLDTPTPADAALAHLADMWAAGEAHLSGLLQRPLAETLADDALEWPRRLPHLGGEVSSYAPHEGVLLSHLGGDAAAWHPVSAFAEWCRAPHWPEQRLADGAVAAGQVRGHCARVGELRTVLQQLEMGNEARRLDPAGLVGTVTSHNQVGRGCIHFAEPRMFTALEKARFQTLPDWLVHCGSLAKVELQTGNAVPYVLAAEVAASVWEAATGEPGRRPPDLAGPSPSGVGLAPDQMPAYRAWVQTVPDWSAVVTESRAALAAALCVAT